MATDDQFAVPKYAEGASGTGDVDVDSLIIDALTVYRQRVRIAGEAATELAEVKNTPVNSTNYGLVTKDINSETARLLAETNYAINSIHDIDKDNSLNVKLSLCTSGPVR